ncbi:Coiled-coil domain-containing protein 21, putative isoform 2 [Cinnamomum micranthum f. kanehirae]|uniref:Coiled-coil domain-containing protein 21, putative isoform 2 n=1 Tax=Cinnamomum micranthum f. kanehirae TaxID=337451 RepID=A0A443NX05_9MAGN|nr:Coiled-coil domain-containing protein 21, putative isoform 2 [Cinnamomum micranthum f. kanehirae]
MSFIAGRLAATESAYFFQESKHAVGRLSEKKKLSPPSNATLKPKKTHEEAAAHEADVLPEILRHSLPIKAFHYQPPSLPTISTASKWKASSSSSSLSFRPPLYDAHNPLREVLCLPQVTFGPRRWNLPNEENSVVASTANELRRESMQTHVDSKKVRAAEEGLSQIGKSLAIATTAVFGGATVTFMLTASKLQVHNSEDFRAKGRELLQPRFEAIREQVGPLRDWAEQMSRKWHYKGEEEAKEKPIIIRELSKRLGVKTPN